MFDHFHHHARNVNVDMNSRVTVTEQRAPTDESVRLLREMEKTARDNVLGSWRLENNPGIKGVVHVYYEPMTDEVALMCRYVWDGKMHEVVHRDRPPLEWPSTKAKAEMMYALRDELAKSIALNMLQGSFHPSTWRF